MFAKLSLIDRVVVTGIGVISPLGCDLDTFWRRLCAGDVSADGRPEFTGHIDDFGPINSSTKRLIRKSLKLMNRETQLGVAAAQRAITASGLLDANYDADRVGVYFGAGNVEIRQDDFAAGVAACRTASGRFDPTTWGDLGISHVDPLWILRVLPNMPACHSAIANDFRGPNNTITQADVATNMALIEARNAIIDGDADAMVVGGAGTNLFQSQPSTCRHPAEAAGAFVLERLDTALDRQATIFGEILAGGAATAIDYDHRARPASAIHHALATALERSKCRHDSIAHINSDLGITEFSATCDQPVFSVKRQTGDAAAGSGALEIAASLLALQNECLPDGSASPGTVAINVNATINGLASCVVMGTVQKRIAA